MIATRSLVSTLQLSALRLDVPIQADRLEVWGAVLRHLKRGVSNRVAILDRRLNASAWWPSETARGVGTCELDEVARWCLRTGRVRVLPRPDPYSAGEATALLPLRERGDVTAVLMVTLEGPAAGGSLEELTSFADYVSSHLTSRAWEREAALLALLAARLNIATTLDASARTSTATLAKGLAASAGVLLELQGPQLRPVAAWGENAEHVFAGAPGAAAVTEYPLRDVVIDRQLRFVGEHEVADDPLLPGLPRHPTLLVPLEGSGAVRSVLALTFEPDRVPPETVIPTILAATDVISARHASLRRERTTRTLDGLLTRTRREGGSRLLERLLASALTLVPGAARGWAFTRTEAGHYACGVESPTATAIKFDEESAKAMYQGSEAEWECGLPRPFHGVAVEGETLRVTGQGGETDPRCICVPLAAFGTAMGFLLLFDAHPVNRFDDESTHVARQLSACASQALTAHAGPSSV